MSVSTGLPCSAANTSGCFQAGGVLGRIPADRLYQPGINTLNIYPSPNFSGGSGINYTSQAPTTNPRRGTVCAACWKSLIAVASGLGTAAGFWVGVGWVASQL